MDLGIDDDDTLPPVSPIDPSLLSQRDTEELVRVALYESRSVLDSLCSVDSIDRFPLEPDASSSSDIEDVDELYDEREFRYSSKMVLRHPVEWDAFKIGLSGVFHDLKKTPWIANAMMEYNSKMDVYSGRDGSAESLFIESESRIRDEHDAYMHVTRERWRGRRNYLRNEFTKHLADIRSGIDLAIQNALHQQRYMLTRELERVFRSKMEIFIQKIMREKIQWRTHAVELQQRIDSLLNEIEVQKTVIHDADFEDPLDTIQHQKGEISALREDVTSLTKALQEMQLKNQRLEEVNKSREQDILNIQAMYDEENKKSTRLQEEARKSKKKADELSRIVAAQGINLDDIPSMEAWSEMSPEQQYQSFVAAQFQAKQSREEAQRMREELNAQVENFQSYQLQAETTIEQLRFRVAEVEDELTKLHIIIRNLSLDILNKDQMYTKYFTSSKISKLNQNFHSIVERKGADEILLPSVGSMPPAISSELDPRIDRWMKNFISRGCGMVSPSVSKSDIPRGKVVRQNYLSTTGKQSARPRIPDSDGRTDPAHTSNILNTNRSSLPLQELYGSANVTITEPIRREATPRPKSASYVERRKWNEEDELCNVFSHHKNLSFVTQTSADDVEIAMNLIQNDVEERKKAFSNFLRSRPVSAQDRSRTGSSQYDGISSSNWSETVSSSQLEDYASYNFGSGTKSVEGIHRIPLKTSKESIHSVRSGDGSASSRKHQTSSSVSGDGDCKDGKDALQCVTPAPPVSSSSRSSNPRKSFHGRMDHARALLTRRLSTAKPG